MLELLEGFFRLISRCELDKAETTMVGTIDLLRQANFGQGSVLLEEGADVSRCCLEGQVLDQQLVCLSILVVGVASIVLAILDDLRLLGGLLGLLDGALALREAQLQSVVINHGIL